ncbi:isopentenyl-diphosphate Delta-isomerase [Microbacterium sp. YY-03]|uniref:isopentenyl-diphosphate Delta-isomerase n=1 Tax=Microbacterium sp. YY-03 TaxID=3421636 RepID=UPI003D16CA5E
MAESPELVVLLDNDGVPRGSLPKRDAHSVDTPLHLAFSCYISNERGELLVTRRALTKQTWPGVWTNSVCGHPAPGESMADAVERRARFELGATITNLTLQLPDFRYRAVDASGIVENEICPVFTAELASPLAPEAIEVSEWAWVSPAHLAIAIAAAPFAFSPWLREQLPLLTSINAFATVRAS